VGLRRAHGKGSGALVRVETMPANELPTGEPAQARQERPGDRGERGKFAPGNSMARAGGKALHGKTRLSARLGLSVLPEDAAFRPYKAAASSFRRAHCAELAKTVGGGMCGPGPSSIVASAALALAWSRYLSDLAAKTGEVDLAIKSMRLAETSRQSLLTAHELCAREAVARASQRGPADPLARWHATSTPTAATDGSTGVVTDGDDTRAEQESESSQ
jgi:hypothetical protein